MKLRRSNQASHELDIEPAGEVWGIPYDLRLPTAARLARRWWNPADSRVVVPRTFGIGWGLNLGAIAERLGWVDAGAHAPVLHSRYPRGAAGLVGALPAALVPLILVARGLPAQTPTHWKLSGEPDKFSSRVPAALGLSAAALAPAVGAQILIAQGREEDALVVGVGAAMVGSAAVGATLAATSKGKRGGLWVPLTLAAATAGGIALLARAARR